MKCFICDSNMKKYGQVEGKIINKCPYCGLGQTIGVSEQKAEYHRDSEYKEEENLFNNIFEKRVNIISQLKKPGKVLEVGCSTGVMLNLLSKRGWSVLGIEISKSSAEIARNKGVEVLSKKFENVESKEKFDLIIFNHTLEHLKNPPVVLKKVRGLLNKDGLLYIDLPNFGGLSANLIGVKWPLLLPNEHFWHFTEKSLSLFLKKNGFKTIKMEKASGIWDYGNPLKGILYSLINLKKRFFKETVTAIPSWFITKLGLGSDLMIISKKL